MLTRSQVPYTGPYSSDDTKMPHKGPTVKALKRMMVREKRMSPPEGGMANLTETWPAGGKFDQAFRKWQQDNELPSDGVYGQQTWKYARAEKLPNGDHSLDLLAQQLIREEWKQENVPDEEDFRAHLVAFCIAAERNEDNWHYLQKRPIDVTINPQATYIWSDCSGYVIQAYHYARTKSGLMVPDPSKQNWSGYGNTDLYEDDHPRVSPPYKVGDLAHYSGHVTLCRRAGDGQTAVFSSHGQEAGPMPVSLHYRSDLRFVVRPPLK